LKDKKINPCSNAAQAADSEMADLIAISAQKCDHLRSLEGYIISESPPSHMDNRQESEN